MEGPDLRRLKSRLTIAQADVEGRPSAHELEIALEEVQALWDELAVQADHLVRERERYAVLFERAPYACLITDLLGTIREANFAAAALLEAPVAYLLGKPLAIFITDNERESFRMHLATSSRHPQPAETWPSCVKSSNGRVRAVRLDLRAMPFVVDGPQQMLWFLHDQG
jgi:PAS domain S-box-containing protein